MSGKFVRASKYRHVFGQAAKKELCYENLKITKNAWDSNIIASNGDFLSVNWSTSGGGSFAVIPMLEVGKAPDTVPLYRGHKGPVLDICFDPFDKKRLASCSDDGKIFIWEIPSDYSFHNYVDANNEVIDITEPIQVLSGHTRKVGHVEYHPCAQNVLASCSMDYSLKIWNLESGKCELTLQHDDLVTSFAFNYNGSLLATTSRDKILRIWDIRSEKVISEGPGHSGAKPSRVIWAGNTDRIISTGFSRLSDRQVGLWDANNIQSGPIGGYMVIDASSGVLIPYFDTAASMLYLAGKGDGNIRYYELEDDVLYELSQYASTDPQRGFAAAPKSSVHIKENEILRSFKTVNDSLIEPVSFIVPRRSELFQEDIYPDCPSSEAALSASEFFLGKTVNGPLLMNMESLYDGVEPNIREADPMIKFSNANKVSVDEVQSASRSNASVKAPAQHNSARDEPSATKQSSTPVFMTLKSVHEILDSSNEVNSLIDKVKNRFENEEDVCDEEWEKTTGAYKTHGIPTREATLGKTAEAATQDETRLTATVSTSEDTTTASNPKDKWTPSREEPEKILSGSESIHVANMKPGSLESMIQQLVGIVVKLESEVSKLAAANTERDAVLRSLETKLEYILSNKI